MNGLYIYFPIHIKSIYKNIAFFDLNENKRCIEEILNIENEILMYFTKMGVIHTNYSQSSGNDMYNAKQKYKEKINIIYKNTEDKTQNYIAPLSVETPMNTVIHNYNETFPSETETLPSETETLSSETLQRRCNFSSIKKQLSTGMIKLNSFTNVKFTSEKNIFNKDYKCVLKIAGIWENNNTIGITYKFLQMPTINNI
jgi:hypothetical protein